MSTKSTYKEFEKQIAELEQQVDQYQNEAIKYQTLFENMAQGVFYQRADGVLIDYNTGFKV